MAAPFLGGVSVNKMHCGTRYLRIRSGPLKDEYVHILVAEAKIGRKLLPDETVDHLDGDGLNCAPENLEVVSLEENARRMHERHERNGTPINGKNGKVEASKRRKRESRVDSADGTNRTDKGVEFDPSTFE